ncbi:butyrophilin subfamily 2 member A2 [Lates calcarifer]|uniref:Butyrophilin subfamily 2 member A2 n=1 Tax=Lates calcarifer TaxID=8187 RepID=A0AAJ7LZ02_LATCA|nr:butyrophilin subfamily 2 member A2 [Lates calcarifer]
MMFVHTDTKSPTSPLRALSVLVFLLLLIHLCTGQSLIGSSQPIVATHGDNVTLPCRLDPAEDVTDLTVEWTRPDLDPRFVHVRRSGQELVSKKHPWFRERTSLFINELKHGNISLKLSRVKLSDQGTYRCFIPGKEKLSSVQLFVASDAVSSPVITLAGVDKTTGGVVLHCSSSRWHPEPEVLWLDGEGNLLSAGPTETVRGPDDLYTVSSRVTVEKRHSNSFTCRVQQNNINQTTEAEIHIQDDFFIFLSSSNVPIIIGWAVSLAVCIIVILSLVFLFLKRRQNKTITKRSRSEETEEGEKKKSSKRNKNKGPVVDDLETKRTTSQQNPLLSLDGVQRKEEPEEEVERLRKQLENKETEFKEKQTELHKLRTENQRLKTDLQNLENKLQRKQTDAEREEKRLKDQLESKTKKVKDRGAEIQQLQDQNRDLQRLNQDLENKNKQLERNQTAAEREEERLKSQTKQSAGRVSESQSSQVKSSSSVSQSSTIIVDEIDPEGKYIHLRNLSSEDQPLGGWRMDVKVDDRKHIMYTFRRFTLRAKETVTIWAAGCGKSLSTKTELVWAGQPSWGTGNQTVVTLFNDSRQEVTRRTRTARH